ncbi:hypothetical protein MNBD_GAMMA12-408 [hydrothermal vent metagenome]|uniref:HTH tetR-type domain-containing protein n=1 Tax=hydrothermal vent metagenome TaxID=652676 RepID=A0A3B0YY93_9ZZZZ
MARPIEYDKQEVLDSITKAFWLKGFEGTSVSELVNETRLNTRTMYNLFSDKTGLFQAALENYHESNLQSIIEKLKNCDTLSCLIEFVESFASSDYLNGCLFVNTLSEQNSISNESLEFVRDYFKQCEELLEGQLAKSKTSNEFSGDVKATASMIICFMHGYSNFVKLNKEEEGNQQMVDQFVLLLNQ